MRAFRHLAAVAALMLVLVAVFATVLATPTEASPTRLKPLADGVVVTESENYVGSPAVNEPQYGEVQDVGPGVFSPFTGDRIPLDVSVGDTVLYLPTDAIEIELEGQTYFVISQPAIIGVLR
jgi:chaperonin GroES